MIDLENVDKVVDRTGVSYEKAKEALEKADNDVIAAIILLEQDNPKADETMRIKSKMIIDVIKEIINEGTATHIQIRKNGKSIIDLPIIIGAVSLIWAPLIGILGVGAVFVYNYEIYIEKEDGTTVDVIEFTKKKLYEVKTKVNKN